MKKLIPIRLFCFILAFVCLLLSVASNGQTNRNPLANIVQKSNSDAQRLKFYERVLRESQYSKPDSAVFYLKQGLSEFTVTNYKPGVASMLSFLSVIYSDQNMTELAQSAVEKALKIYIELKDRRGVAATHNITGVIYSRNGFYNDAESQFFKALKIFEAIRDTDGITNTYIKLGGNAEHGGDLAKALDYYGKGLEILKDRPSTDLVLCRNSNIEAFFKDKKDNFISRKYLQKMLDASKDSGYAETLPIADMTKVLVKEGDINKALNYSRQALNLVIKDWIPSLSAGLSGDKNEFIPKTDPQKTRDLIASLEGVAAGSNFNTLQKIEIQNPKIWNMPVNIADKSIVNPVPDPALQYFKLRGDFFSVTNTSTFNEVRATDFQSSFDLFTLPLSISNELAVTSSQRVYPITNGKTGSESFNIANASWSMIPNSDILNPYYLFGWTINVAGNNSEGSIIKIAPKAGYPQSEKIVAGVAGINYESSLAKIRKADPQNTSQILSESLKIAEASNLKKIQASLLETQIAASKDKGDFELAVSLLEQQKMLMDSIVFIDNELAITGIETLYDINKLNSKVEQLELSTQEEQHGKNLIFLIAGFLAVGLMLVTFFWARARIINKELYKSSLTLKNAGSVKNRLISVIAHDLTGSLGFMPLSLGLCRDKSIPDEEKEALLNQLEVNANSSFETLQNMLDWGKVQIQGVTLNQASINVNNVLAEVMQFVGIAAVNKQITIKNEIDNDLAVFADPNHVKFIFRNLLSNAIKYSQFNGTIWVGAKLSDDLLKVCFSVKDAGVGISENQQKHIFSSKTESTAGTDNEKGNGIGLNLCKEFVTENGGEIWFESEENKGSAFYFSLKAINKSDSAAV